MVLGLLFATLLLSGHSSEVLDDAIAHLERDLTQDFTSASAELRLEEVMTAKDCLQILIDGIGELDKKQFLRFAIFNAEKQSCDIDKKVIEFNEGDHTEKALFNSLPEALDLDPQTQLVILTVNSPCAPGSGSSGSMESDSMVYSCLQGMNEQPLAIAKRVVVGFNRLFNKQNQGIMENAVSMAHYIKDNQLNYDLYARVSNLWSEPQLKALEIFTTDPEIPKVDSGSKKKLKIDVLVKITGINLKKLVKREKSVLQTLDERLVTAKKSVSELEGRILTLRELNANHQDELDRLAVSTSEEATTSETDPE